MIKADRPRIAIVVMLFVFKVSAERGNRIPLHPISAIGSTDILHTLFRLSRTYIIMCNIAQLIYIASIYNYLT
jgi:hypothetical protein